MDQNHLQQLQELDAAYHLHPFNDNAALAKKGTRILTRGEGCYVWDAEGNKLLDAFAGLWCVNLGYGRKELGEAASRQMQQLAYYNSFFSCTTEPTVQLAAKLAELTPGDLNHAFFTNSGSEANDTILRMVRHFWAVQDQPQKNIVIGRHNAYHGSTVAGASLIKEWKEMIDKAVETNPREHLLTRGWITFSLCTIFDAAINDIDALEDLVKGDLGYTGDGVYHLNIMKALCYKKLGNTEKALDIMETQLAKEDYHFGLFDYLHLGVLYLENKDYSKSIENLDRLVSFSDVSEIYYYKALAMKGLNKWDEHKLNLEKAKDYYIKNISMENPFIQMIDEIYLVDIENEMGVVSK